MILMLSEEVVYLTEKLFNDAKKIMSLNKNSVLIMLFLLILIIGGGIRSCNRSTTVDLTKTFVIARDPSWYPLNLMGKNQNVLAFTNDLLLTIAKEKGVRLELLSISSNRLDLGLDSGDYDGIITSLMPDPQNNRYYNFSSTLFFVGPVLVVPIDSKVTSIEQMSNKIVGIPSNLEISVDLNKFTAIFKPYINIRTAFTDLMQNHLDGIILPVMQAYNFIEAFHKGLFKIVSGPLTDQGLRIVTLQTIRSEFVIKEFNDGLNRLIENGTYDALCKKWGLVNPFTMEKKHE